MKLVTISHPDVGTVQVPASAVPHHAASGWSVVEDDAPTKSTASAAPAEASTDPADGSASKSKGSK